jgi:hypothetical protein
LKAQENFGTQKVQGLIIWAMMPGTQLKNLALFPERLGDPVFYLVPYPPNGFDLIFF